MTFSVLTLNLRHGQGAMTTRSEKGWYWWRSTAQMRESASRIGSFIAQQHPTSDIVCVQETNAAAFFWPDILSIIQIKADYPYVATASRKILPHNNAIVSRLPITRVFSRQFSALRSLRWGPKALFYSANRGFVAAEIEGIGTIASTHFGPHLPALRLAQARELRRALPARNVILAGDFNPLAWDEESLTAAGEGCAIAPPIDAEQFTSFATWPAPLETGFLTGQAGRLERASLGAGATPLPLGEGEGWVGVAPYEITPERRLDYVFASPEFTIVSAERICTGLTDHLGVLATIASTER